MYTHILNLSLSLYIYIYIYIYIIPSGGARKNYGVWPTPQRAFAVHTSCISHMYNIYIYIYIYVDIYIYIYMCLHM